MVSDTTLGYLKEAINNNSLRIKELKDSNKVLAISNLIGSGVLSIEEAMNDSAFADFIVNIKSKNNCESRNTIKAKIK